MVTIPMRGFLIPFLLAVAMTASGPAWAHAHLKKADPPVGSDVSPGPAQLRLVFSEGVELAFSKVEIVMGDGMAIAPAAVALAPDDPTTIIVSLKAKLDPGRYAVTWHVVSVDTHKTQGHYDFTVKP